MKVVRSEIDIDAPAERVWNIVVDLARYPEWNPFTPRIGAESIVVGKEFTLDCWMTEKQLLRDEKEVFLAYEPEQYRVCWGTSRTRGRPGIKSFRWQICQPLDGHRTHFINYEEFHGVLAPLVNLLYGKKLQRAFDRYCRALKGRAES
ncbi:MAG: hypothetical protein DRI39_02925 [Chloroflexi bacterium]|nr:MAG: hypothetical protein DRI39_02925 [Chloroflexota bacterium]